MRLARSVLVMITASTLVVGYGTHGPPVARAADPTPAPTAAPSPAPTAPPTAAPSPAPTAMPGTITQSPLPRVDVQGGPRLAEKGEVVDLSGGAGPLPDVKARTWVLADATTGEVLAAKNAHKKRRPASTLKTLTALTLLPELDPNGVWVGTAKAQNTYGSKVGIRKGREYTIEELFYGLMLPSGNDAAIALGQANSSVKKTVEQMNEVAQDLQANNTTAKNTSGLDAKGQLSTAYDLTLIARAALEREDFRRYATTKKAEFPNPKKKRKKPITIYNQNDLVMDDYPGVIGVKTGFTSKAGRTFIGAAERDGRILIVTLMGIGEPSDVAAKKLLNWGFKNGDRIVPVGQLTGATSLETTTETEIVEAEQPQLVSVTSTDDVDLITTQQAPSLASLTPSAWGWLALFTAIAVFALGAMGRTLFNRRRRRLAE